MTKAAELAKIVDASGNVVTSGTVEPAGDTAAGDNAAIGFTSAEGIVITGQGSTNDVTIKNDADADVIEIPTGTTNVTVAGTLTATGFIIGSADINENDLESIDGITAGTVAASKAAIVDTNKDITGFRNITLTGELDAATLDVSGDADIDGTLEADAITIGGTAIASVLSPVAGSSSIVTTGALNSGSITSGFGTIDTGSSNITSTGVGTFGSLDISGDIDVDGTTNLDVVDIDGTLNVQGETTLQTHLNMGDNDTIKLGASADLQIYHDGSNSYIDDSGTGKLFARSSQFQVQKYTGENMIVAVADGRVDLYYDNVKKLETTSSGVTVTGDIANSSGSLTIDSASQMILDAAGGNHQLFVDGTEYGRFFVSSGDFYIYNPTSDKDIKFYGNDGGSAFTALTLDMADAGAATLNNGLTLTDGNLVVASGHGIDFSAASNNSGVTSELLDDYEEGTYTIAEPSGQATITNNRVHYTKIGRLVTVQASITVGSNSNTNTLNLNLPFASTINGYYLGGGNIGYTTASSSYVNNNMRPNIENAADNVFFITTSNTGLTCANLSGIRIDFAISYYT
jgi:cytoskeletal protein CcmA (bactofilin family)